MWRAARSCPQLQPASSSPGGNMGEFPGLRPETISRKMTEFQRRKWIRMTSTYRCRILNRSVLRALAEGCVAEYASHGRLLC